MLESSLAISGGRRQSVPSAIAVPQGLDVSSARICAPAESQNDYGEISPLQSEARAAVQPEKWAGL